jgi:hypothetical protein
LSFDLGGRLMSMTNQKFIGELYKALLRERRFAREAELIELLLINFAHLYSSPKKTESRSVPATRWLRSIELVSSELQLIGPNLEKRISKGPWTKATEAYQLSFMVSLAGLGNPTFEISKSKIL